MRRAKDQAEYGLKVGLIDLLVKDEASTRGALREEPVLTKRALERIKFNQTLMPQDLSLIVGARPSSMRKLSRLGCLHARLSRSGLASCSRQVLNSATHSLIRVPAMRRF
jgi:hypothetical protein